MFKYELGIAVFTRVKDKTVLGDTQCLMYQGCRYSYNNTTVQYVACLEASGLIDFAEYTKGRLTSSPDDTLLEL